MSVRPTGPSYAFEDVRLELIEVILERFSSSDPEPLRAEIEQLLIDLMDVTGQSDLNASMCAAYEAFHK